MRHSRTIVLQEDHQEGDPPAEAPLETDELTEALTEGYLHFEAILESQVAPGVWDVTIMESGWSKNRRHYSAGLVRAAAPLFEGASVARYGGGHLPPQFRRRDYGPTDNSVGVTAKPWVEELPGGEVRLKALYHCSDPLENSKMQTAQEAVGEGPVPNYGLSIDARGPQRIGSLGGQSGIIVDGIEKVLETTLVIKPAAGGGVGRRIVAGMDDEEDEMNKRLLAFLIGRAAVKGRSVTDLLALQEADVAARTATELQEMIGANTVLTMALEMLAGNKLEQAQGLLQGLLDALPKSAPETAIAPAATAPAAQTAVATAEVPDAGTATAASGPAQESVVQDLQMQVALLQSGLPQGAQDSVRAEMLRIGRFTPQQLQEAITDRRALISSPARANGLAGQSMEVSSRGCTQPQEALQYRIDLLTGYRPDQALMEADPAAFAAYKDLLKHPAMNRIKRIFQDYHDDSNCEFVIGNNSILHEALSTDFPTALSIAMNKTLLQHWDMQDPPDWAPFVYIDETVDDYYARTNLMRGGFGNMGSVSESDSADTFSVLGTPQEMSTSFSIVSKGGKFVLTKHMVKGDKNGIFENLVQAFVNMCIHVLNRFVWGLITGRTAAGINEALTWDNTKIYTAGHGNYTTNALSQTNIAVGRQQLRNMRRPGLKTTITEAQASTSEETFVLASTVGIFPDTMLQAVVGGEIIRVKSVTNSTDVEAERGYLGTTATTHLDNAVFSEVIDQMPPKQIGIIVPTQKETALYTALTTPGVTGGTNNDLSIVNKEFEKGQLVPVVVDPHYLGGNLFNWFMLVYAKYKRHTTLAFMDNKQKPTVLLQDQPTVGKVFERNNYTYRTEFEFGGCNNDFLGMQGNFANS